MGRDIDVERYLRDEGYEEFEFMRMSGKYWIYKVKSGWNGWQELEVEKELFGGYSKRVIG